MEKQAFRKKLPEPEQNVKKERCEMDLTGFFGGDWVYIQRLLAAMLFGGLVGLERQIRGRPAGLRTNILVCVGSATVIVAFQKLFMELDPFLYPALRMDPARAAAGVVSGIGFLGAGTIVKSKDFVRGLTTAASIWVVAAIGITLGLGQYDIALALTLLVLVALYILHHIPIRSDHFFTLHLEWHGHSSLLDETTARLKTEKLKIRNRKIMRQPQSGKCQATLVLQCRKEYSPILDQLLEDSRFDEVSWY